MLNVLAVFVGGLIGTAVRFDLDILIPHTVIQPGWSTIIVNISGSFILGVLTSTLWRRPSTPSWVKAGLGTGVIGSFTTFSAVSVGVEMAGLSGKINTALIDLGFSLVGGLLAAFIGILVGSKVFNRPRPEAVIPDDGVDL